MKQILNTLKQRLRTLGSSQAHPSEANLRQAPADKAASSGNTKRSELDPATASSGTKPSEKAALDQAQQPPPTQSRTKKAVLSKPRQNPLHAPSAGGLWGASAATSSAPAPDPLGLAQAPADTNAGAALTGSILEPNGGGTSSAAPAHPRSSPTRPGLFGAEAPAASRYSFFAGAGAGEQSGAATEGSMFEPTSSLFGTPARSDSSDRGPF